MNKLLQTQRTLLVLVAAAAAILVGCAANPIAAAETVAQRAYAIERSYNIVLEEAVAFVQANPTQRPRVLAIETRTTPIIDSLGQALAAYQVARAQFDAGQSTIERVAVVAQNLDAWLTQAQTALVQLSEAID